MKKAILFICLMVVSGCAITPETTNRIAKEHARFNDRLCSKYNALVKKLELKGFETISQAEYMDIVNSNAKRSYQVLECN